MNLMAWFALRRRREVAAVFLVALFIRVGYMWQQGPLPPLIGDAGEYHSYATNLLSTGRYVGEHGEQATRMPGYPLFLAVLYALFGESVRAVQWTQCLIGALSCVLMYGLAAELLTAPWPLFCGLAGAVYYDLYSTCPFIWSECLYSFFLVLSARLLYKSGWPPTRRALLFGLASGCLYLVRPEPLPYIVGTCIALPWLFPLFGRKQVFAALAALGLICGLWVGRNYVVFDRVVPSSSVGKRVLYLTLYLQASQFGYVPQTSVTPPEGLGELDRDAHYVPEFKKLFQALKPSQLVRIYAFHGLSILYPFLPEYDLSYMLLVPFWLIGFWRALRRKEFAPLAAAVICSISIFLFFGGPASRYRFGISPFFIVLAAFGLEGFVSALPRAQAIGTGIAWIGGNLLIAAFSQQLRVVILWLKALALR